MGPIQHIHGGNLRAAAAKYGLNPAEIIDFSANINPLGPSPQVEKAIVNAMPGMVHYPDPDCTELKKALAVYLDLDVERIAAGNGAAELIYLLVNVLRPKRVLLPQPTFSEYEIAVITGGGRVTDYPLSPENGFRPATAEIAAMLPEVDMVIICNPNNPTGALVSKDELVTILQGARNRQVTVVIDEAFMDFVAERDNYSTAALLRDFPNLFILYSLTKFFAIPGLRLGAGLGNPDLVSKMEMARDPWNVNCFAQAAGVVSLRDEAYIKKSIGFIQQEKQYLYGQLGSIEGLRPFLPAANFVFTDIRTTGLTAPEMTDRLGRRGILVRDCSSYKNLDPYYIRVAVRTRKENDKLLAIISDIIRSEK
jgi:threonine-phosphate decarboxylase